MLVELCAVLKHDLAGIHFTRRLRSLTLKDVSNVAGCSESLLSKIENGHASPSLRMLQRLAHALGLTIGQLFAQQSQSNDVVMRAATRMTFDTEDGGKGRVEPLAPHSGGHMLECHLHRRLPWNPALHRRPCRSSGKSA
jgi:transcriptional regulator with XRE-family HTH domain